MTKGPSTGSLPRSGRVHSCTAIAAIALGVMMAASSLALLPSARADIGMPSWQPGDWWQYSMTNASSPAGGTGPGTLKVLVIGQTDTTVAGVAYPTYDTRDWLNVTSGSVTYSLAGDTWFRTSDLSPVRATFEFATTYRGTPVTIVVTLTYAPPQTMMWPLATGAMWSSTSTQTTTSLTTVGSYSTTNTTSQSVDDQYTVQVTGQVTVPRGTYSVTPVQQTELGVPGYIVTYWSGDVGNDVKQATYDSNGYERSSEDLTNYSYTPPASGTASFLGIAYWLWLVIVAIAAAVIVAATLFLRPKRPAPSDLPPTQATPPPPPRSSPPGAP